MNTIKSVSAALQRAHTSTRRVPTCTPGVYDEVKSYSLRTSDVAAIIREVLAREYPKVKFYVRSQTYAGGSSIDVYYDGKAEGAPTRKEVAAITDAYETQGFDGMIDMSFSKYRWLCPDGKVRGLITGGTDCSRGIYSEVNETQPEPMAVLMTGGAGFVFEHDSLPYDVQEKMEKKAA